jgi:myosin-5
VLVDDVAFIAEVRQGVVQAPDMNPAYELTKLKKKFEIWKREFKDKLKTTEDVLKKLDKLGGGAAAEGRAAQSHPSSGAKRSGGMLGAMFKP